MTAEASLFGAGRIFRRRKTKSEADAEAAGRRRCVQAECTRERRKIGARDGGKIEVLLSALLESMSGLISCQL